MDILDWNILVCIIFFFYEIILNCDFKRVIDVIKALLLDRNDACSNLGLELTFQIFFDF